MSKAVLISIRPYWCGLIANGQKTIDVRKTRPRIDTPFKCYIYESRGDEQYGNADYHPIVRGCGRQKIIGEFVCDMIQDVDNPYLSWLEEKTCVDMNDIAKYKGDKEYIYGWHISDLQIYDKPKEIGEYGDFYFPPEKYCEKELCGGCPHDQLIGLDGDYEYDCEWKRPIMRAPQSWCYVEEVKNA